MLHRGVDRADIGDQARLGGLSLAQRAALTGGADTWHTVALPDAGVPALCMTDGPAGARGPRFFGTPASSLPCGTALAATWDRDLVCRVGKLLGDEARGKGAQLLLAPTVNVHRHPLGGRNFEAFSEDPYLSAEIADAYIRGVQSRGVGCAIKHLVANDQETDRREVSVDVDERALREVYLPAFEKAVRASDVWAVMTAYNRLHGIHCSEHFGLLEEVLRREWGFAGVIVSDWFGTYSTLAVSAGLDLEMPGPARFLGRHLASAVRQGEVSPAVLDRAAGNVLGLVEKAGAVSADELPTGEDPRLVARNAATQAIVLLKNDAGVLPLAPTRPTTIAVIGHHADWPDTQGSGSAHVDPAYVVTPLAGIEARSQEAAGVTVIHEPGIAHRPRQPLTRRELRCPGTDEAGLLVEYFQGDAETPVLSEVASETRLFWLGIPAPGLSQGDSCRVRASADVIPERSGTWQLGLSSVGRAQLQLDGTVLVDNVDAKRGRSFFGRGKAEQTAAEELIAGQRYRLVIDLDIPARRMRGINGLNLEAQAPPLPNARQRALAAAARADVAVVVAGEAVASTEGDDRRSMDLPQEQDELITGVAATNERTIVLVNTGAPVTMPWADEVPAIAQLWYLGQETGTAVADILFGDADPSGRLPTTFPRRLEDTPAHRNFPGRNGRVHYAEGLFVGYRHYDTNGVEPLFGFGHGLSYATFRYGELSVKPHERYRMVAIELEVSNTSERAGSEVVQAYVRHLESPMVRPHQELKQFRRLWLEPGESHSVGLPLDWRAFAHWSVQRHRWAVEPGRYEIRVGASSRDIRQTAVVELSPGFAADPGQQPAHD